MAYYHLGLMESALQQMIAGFDQTAVDGIAAVKTLPASQACHDNVCSFPGGLKPQCAYSFLPKAQGPDVGDWVSNTSSSG